MGSHTVRRIDLVGNDAAAAALHRVRRQSKAPKQPYELSDGDQRYLATFVAIVRQACPDWVFTSADVSRWAAEYATATGEELPRVASVHHTGRAFALHEDQLRRLGIESAGSYGNRKLWRLGDDRRRRS